MRIAVIAAQGRLGRAFVDAALRRGHYVRAGIRGAAGFAAHQNLELVQCDATSADDVRRLLSGQEAVVSAIGHVKGSSPTVQSDATQVVIDAMKALGMSRYVDVTGTGVRLPGDCITLLDRILNLAVGVIDPARVADGKRHVELLQASTLDWTTIRVLKLQNVAPTPYVLTLHGPTKPYVGRAEVATAMLGVLEGKDFLRQAPIISYNKK